MSSGHKSQPTKVPRRFEYWRRRYWKGRTAMVRLVFCQWQRSEALCRLDCRLSRGRPELQGVTTSFDWTERDRTVDTVAKIAIRGGKEMRIAVEPGKACNCDMEIGEHVTVDGRAGVCSRTQGGPVKGHKRREGFEHRYARCR